LRYPARIIFFLLPKYHRSEILRKSKTAAKELVKCKRINQILHKKVVIIVIWLVIKVAKCDISILTSVQILNHHKYTKPLNSSANCGVLISLITNNVVFFAKRGHFYGVLFHFWPVSISSHFYSCSFPSNTKFSPCFPLTIVYNKIS
jgi:hypothetical protein